jgi:predicted amidophosphoribosyltransferase
MQTSKSAVQFNQRGYDQSGRVARQLQKALASRYRARKAARYHDPIDKHHLAN